ncbi:hypothetical protein ACFL5V_02135 [Fibrobacterota bacterium]
MVQARAVSRAMAKYLSSLSDQELHGVSRKKMAKSLKKMAGAKKLRRFRKEYNNISLMLIDIMKEKKDIGPFNPIIFHCPVGEIRKGSYWLQEHDELQNPYHKGHGHGMHSCGRMVGYVKGNK